MAKLKNKIIVNINVAVEFPITYGKLKTDNTDGDITMLMTVHDPNRIIINVDNSPIILNDVIISKISKLIAQYGADNGS